MIKCGSEGCEREATHIIRFSTKSEWLPACVFHAAFMESVGCEIKILEDYEREKGSV